MVEQRIPVKRAPSAAETAASTAEEPVMQVRSTAVSNAKAVNLEATQSAIANATVEGDSKVNTSAVGMLSAKGNADLSQGFAGAVVAEGDIAMRQAGGGVVVGRNVGIEQGGSGVLVASETNASHSYVGLLLSRRASFSEDSRVLFDWKAALILAAVVLGGVGIVIVVAIVLAKMIVGRAHRVVERLPHIPTPHLPELPPWAHWVVNRIRAA